MDIKQALASKVSQFRKKNGISQTNLSKHLGLPYTTVVAIENKRINVNQTQLAKIADYFGVTVDYLLGRESDEGKPDMRGKLMRRFREMKSLNEDQLQAMMLVIDTLLRAYGIKGGEGE